MKNTSIVVMIMSTLLVANVAVAKDLPGGNSPSAGQSISSPSSNSSIGSMSSGKTIITNYPDSVNLQKFTNGQPNGIVGVTKGVGAYNCNFGGPNTCVGSPSLVGPPPH